MKNYVLMTLVASGIFMSCSKEKTDVQSNDSIVTETLPSDTSMALPPSYSTAMNAPLNMDSANTTKDSVGTSMGR